MATNYVELRHYSSKRHLMERRSLVRMCGYYGSNATLILAKDLRTVSKCDQLSTIQQFFLRENSRGN